VPPRARRPSLDYYILFFFGLIIIPYLIDPIRIRIFSMMQGPSRIEGDEKISVDNAFVYFARALQVEDMSLHALI
jgi:hypothetical protein